MKIDGHGFQEKWAWDHTEDQFVNEFKDMPHIFPDAPDKVAKLKEAHKVLQQNKPKDYVPPKAPQVAAAPEQTKSNAGSPAGQKAPEAAGKTA